MTSIIEVKGISKKYKINHQRGGYITLRDVLTNIIKRPFSYVKVKSKKIAGLEKKEDFWALKGVDFEINKGEVIGIIGHNGAGKSTLLKILSQITPPTEGEIIIKGTVGSLLEVGTGFHPELTGRENIFLNGAILNMSQKEIASKFDQIVEFSGIGKFLDTPVKYYSSGMYVRLAFSVAAHMEPDILLVDEVLAVGDAEFQKKCLGKMEEVTKKSGRTIIFVSHNMEAISRLCERCVLLEKGKVVAIGPTDEVINKYIQLKESIPSEYVNNDPSADSKSYGYIKKIQVEDEDNVAVDTISAGLPWKTRVNFKINEFTPSFILGMSIRGANNVTVRTTWSKPQDLEPGNYEAVISDDVINLSSRTYTLTFGLSSFKKSFENLEDCVSIKIVPEGANIDSERILTVSGGEVIINPMDISIKKIN
jgi:lipopolysaccharide transport system ATP-binding protein